jgi:Probable taurine catabolism dioxygenase
MIASEQWLENQSFVLSSLQKNSRLPLLVCPKAPESVLYLDAIRRLAEEQLLDVGGVLFRGFDVLGQEQFQAFARSFGHELMSYEFGSTPRSVVTKGVYTTTEYPAHQVIPQHNEQSYTLNWPMKIWFHCVEAAQQGGETPISDSREVYRRMDPAIRQRFIEKKLMYVRNYGGGLDLPWQQTFNTESKQEVERFCSVQNIGFEWKADGDLRTRQICQGVSKHPKSGDMVWFNQAHLFHISNLAAATRETLLSIVAMEDLPRNVYYGDGSAIEESILDEVRGVLDECTVMFPWQSGDVLMLDNMLVAHGRSTFKGPRKVIVAMAEPNK